MYILLPFGNFYAFPVFLPNFKQRLTCPLFLIFGNPTLSFTFLLVGMSTCTFSAPYSRVEKREREREISLGL